MLPRPFLFADTLSPVVKGRPAPPLAAPTSRETAALAALPKVVRDRIAGLPVITPTTTTPQQQWQQAYDTLMDALALHGSHKSAVYGIYMCPETKRNLRAYFIWKHGEVFGEGLDDYLDDYCGLPICINHKLPPGMIQLEYLARESYGVPGVTPRTSA